MWLSKTVVNDLIYNESTRVVTIFKDYLIFDDINEFFKRGYGLQETRERIPRLSTFYSDYQIQPMIGVSKATSILYQNSLKKVKVQNVQP